MHSEMSQKTRKEVLVQLRRSYAKAGLKFKQQLLNQAVDLFGHHCKSAIRALRAKPPSGPTLAVSSSRPTEYHAETLLPILKSIWFAAFQSCGSRLHALLPEWLPAYEADHRRIDADVRKSLLAASASTFGSVAASLANSGRPALCCERAFPFAEPGKRKVRAG